MSNLTQTNLPEAVRLLTQAYDEQRSRVRSVPRRPGGSDWLLNQEVGQLANIARKLHEAERVAGLPLGSTREQPPFNLDR